MPKDHSFLIYNASAGSGKTFTLVKMYLTVLLQAKSPNHFKHILAITFTNKASGEMKSRILQALTEFSSEDIIENPTELFSQLCKDLNLSANQIHIKSKIVLNEILHNYASFDISTIDGLTHKLIRTFAYDLKLPLNFEVELDTERVLHEAVDRLISKAGTEKALTKLLVDFAIEKADDDKSWDISYDFNKIAKILTNENDWPYLNSLKDKTREDFQILKKHVKERIQQAIKSITQKADSVLTLISECGLEFSDFSGGSRAYLPNYFLKLKQLDFNYSFDKAWIHNLEEKPLYPEKSTTDHIKSILDEIKPRLVSEFNETRDLFYLIQFLKSVYKNITPLSVLHEIQQEVNDLKNEENKLLISEFNTLISREIREQPTPFIYERLGEKFDHYFIDEFQDTSRLQWENLIPLLDNTLASENGSVMLVGDAKQAIYRWRGGKAEQFIDLYNQKVNPFTIKPKVISLESNYRSYKKIIEFNNGFFKFLSSSVFNNLDYEALYSSANQHVEKKQSGYVKLNFLDLNSDDNRDELYAEEVHKTILSCLENGFTLQDICILVRKKKEGIAISEYLSANGITITSSETLLINNSPEVQFIINMLQLTIQPENAEIKIAILNFLAEKQCVKDKHSFFKKHLSITNAVVFQKLDYNLNFSNLGQLSLYELAETLIRVFDLVPESDAYVHYFMDFVLDFTQKQQSDINSFLEFYESKKTQLSIVFPESFNAVQVMTIHKSKGLEFPVVIFPFADLNIYQEKEPKEWFELDEKVFNGFNYTLLNYTKQFEHFGTIGQNIYNTHQAQLELDNINLLYVALTRPVEQLHIISKKDINSKGIVKEHTYSSFFINYLKQLDRWQDNTLTYSFGDEKRDVKIIETDSGNFQELYYTSVSKESHDINIVTKSGYLWDTAQEQAIEKGNLIHLVMSYIKTIHDLELAFDKLETEITLDENQKKALFSTAKQIVNHPKLHQYFSFEGTVYNERDILSNSGEILRPDRLNISSKNNVVIIDYKSGSTDSKHKTQLEDYKAVLNQMGFKVTKQILVYINNTIEVKEF